MAGVRFLVVDNVTSSPIADVYCHDALGGGYTDATGYTSYFERTAGVDTYWTFEKAGYESIIDYWVSPATYDLTFSIHMAPVGAVKKSSNITIMVNAGTPTPMNVTAQGYLTEKDTGLPLGDRTVNIYRDGSRINAVTTDHDTGYYIYIDILEKLDTYTYAAEFTGDINYYGSVAASTTVKKPYLIAVPIMAIGALMLGAAWLKH